MITATRDTASPAQTIDALNAANSSLAKKPASTADDTQDRFLKLLVTQMKNQDPLNPMDNAQVTSQMAQLSTVSGIDKLNSTLQALSDSMAAEQSVSAAGMIGRGVLVPGATLNLANGQALGGIELALPADSVTVKIQDAAGSLVRTLQLGAQKSGVLPLGWDGMTDAGAPAADGAYRFTAEGVLAGNRSTAATLAFGVVNAVIPGARGATLDVGGAGGFALSDVKRVM
ncbi:MAG: flagellar hook assembly protein FlgD [Nitrosomonadales bacterium]|nr:flagellar hook assembly protein FlgD [Nitrosomonadales bacterium]